MKISTRLATLVLAAGTVLAFSGCSYGLLPSEGSSAVSVETSSVSSAPLVDFNASSSEAVSSEASSSEVASSEASSSEVESSSKATSSKAASSKAASSKATSSKAASSKAASSKAASSKASSAEIVSSAASSGKEPYLFLVYKTDSTGVCKITLQNAGNCQIKSVATTGISNAAAGANVSFSIDKTVLTVTATGAAVYDLQIQAENTVDGTKYSFPTTVKAWVE